MCSSDLGEFANPAPSRAPAPEAYRLEPHVCRVCHTRLVSCADAAGRRFECPNCGAGATGRDASVLCCCGMKIRRPLKNGASGQQLVDAGVRCQLNPAPTPEMPSLYVAGHAE